MFDSIIESVAARFGISLDKAKQLLGMLIAVIFNEKRGGAAGFVDLFRSRGLGSIVDSWIGTGPNQPVAPAQLESVLGADMLSAIASRVGVERGVAASAMSAMLPDVFNHLTEDGRVPSDLSIPERLRGYVGDIGDFVKDLGAGLLGVGAAAAGAVGSALGKADRAVDRAVDRTSDAVGDVARATGGGIGRLLPWLIAAALLVGALLWFRGCKKEEAPVPPPAQPAAATTPAQASVPAASPTFSFENVDGTKVNVNGAVATDAEKTRLWDALKATFGDGNVNGDIVVNPNTAPAGWMDKLIGLLPDLKAKGLKFGFDGEKLKLDTSGMSEADRFALSDKFRIAFGGLEITGLWDKAMAALSNLRDGFTGDDLVKALGLMNVYFDTGKATITRDSYEVLTKAADAMKRAPAGTRIEIGGHTDNTGDAAANMTLSQQRADAVVAKLVELGVPAAMLTAKGYGQDKPVADNGTEEGKAKNRRIEYTVAK